MLTMYRRHLKSCSHRTDGRQYRRCKCPIWVDGMLNGRDIRESLKLQNWEKAQELVRKWEAQGGQGTSIPVLTLGESHSRFVSDAEARELRESTLKKYRVLFQQMEAFASDSGLRFLNEWNLETTRRFRESWRDSGISALKKLERMRAFFRFAHESGWISENPAKKIRNPKVVSGPTLPFSGEEMIRILAACGAYTDSYGRTDQANARRLKAFVLLMRYSGMRIGDTAACAKDRLSGGRLFLYTQKTGVPVNVKLPLFVVEELNRIPTISEAHFFWSGQGKVDTVAGNWRRSLRKLFHLANVKGGHPHRFRDTFAVELLLAGVPIERVSVLLGHSSIRVTERHYAPWIRARQEQLEADLERSWAMDPIVLRETKGTPGAHENTKAVN